jgi:hypothetical protein
MSSQSIERKIADLTHRMQQAAIAEDFELAARLRNENEDLKGPSVRKPPPGQMGLGTHVPVSAPPKGWKRPQKPDPMTSHVKRGR